MTREADTSGGSEVRSASLFVSAPSAMVVLGLLLSAALAEAAPSIGWGAAELIETNDDGDAYNPVIAFDASGNAVTVWYQYDGTRYNIWANRYAAGIGWGAAELIETDNTGDAWIPEVAVDSSGNAVAVWVQYNGAQYSIFANRYVAGTGWESAEMIETDDLGAAGSADVAIDSSGNAVAVWYQYDGTRNNIYANRYVVGTGWGTAELIETDSAGDAYNPRISIDASGNAIVVWHQYDGTRHNIYSNRYVVGTGWGTPVLIETSNAGDAYNPEIAIDSSGNAVAVWYQYDGTRYNIWANRYVAGTGWGVAALIETDNTGDALHPDVEVDASGNAVAVWYQWDGAWNSIFANQYVAGTGWGTAEPVETDNTGDAWMPDVAVDGSGNAVTVWYQYDGTRDNVRANRYAVETGWGAAELIETDNTGPARMPEVAFDGSGNAVAVWFQYDGTRNNIWANRYAAPDVTPPPLTLSSPADGTTTDVPAITVSGMTEPEATVSANGVLAPVLGDGSFSCVIALERGTNTIVVTATDSSGNYATVSRTVVFNDPILDLRDELNVTNGELEDLRGDLDEAENELSRTVDDLESIKSQNLMLIVAMAVVGVIAVVALAMYFRLRKLMPLSAEVPAKMEPPPPSE